MAEKTYERNCGAVWIRKNQDNKTWLSLSLELDGEKRSFVAFKNDKGDNDKRPDFHIFPSKNKEAKTEKPDVKTMSKTVAPEPAEEEITL